MYGALPHFLVLWYVLVSKGMSLQYMCRLCILLSFFCGALAVGLIWGLYPRSYSYKASSTGCADERDLFGAFGTSLGKCSAEFSGDVPHANTMSEHNTYVYGNWRRVSGC